MPSASNPPHSRETRLPHGPLPRGAIAAQDLGYCGHLCRVVVDHSYASDLAVAKDQRLQNWINASTDPRRAIFRDFRRHQQGGLEERSQSLVYRVTAHGISRINRAANPALTFTANYPPCLQNSSYLTVKLPWTPKPCSPFFRRLAPSAR